MKDPLEPMRSKPSSYLEPLTSETMLAPYLGPSITKDLACQPVLYYHIPPLPLPTEPLPLKPQTSSVNTLIMATSWNSTKPHPMTPKLTPDEQLCYIKETLYRRCWQTGHQKKGCPNFSQTPPNKGETPSRKTTDLILELLLIEWEKCIKQGLWLWLRECYPQTPLALCNKPHHWLGQTNPDHSWVLQPVEGPILYPHRWYPVTRLFL